MCSSSYRLNVVAFSLRCQTIRHEVSISSTFYKQLFLRADPESTKDTVKLSVFFDLLGSFRANAARRMLVKLTRGGGGKQIVKRWGKRVNRGKKETSTKSLRMALPFSKYSSIFESFFLIYKNLVFLHLTSMETNSIPQKYLMK